MDSKPDWLKWAGIALGAVYMVLLVVQLFFPEGLVVFLVVSAFALIFGASQLFWFNRIRDWGRRLIPNPRWRLGLGIAGVAAYLFFFALFIPEFTLSRRASEPTHLTLLAALREAPFPTWFVCSVLGFFIALILGLVDRLGRAAVWGWRKLIVPRLHDFGTGTVTDDPPSPDRRQFLEQTAYAISAAPFVAGTYGLLYGRLNLQVTHETIRISRLPKAFEGFRIAQLSDIHIGPFMSAEEIRKYVSICNRQKADLVALTGDFVTWDPATQTAAVDALSGLKAPFGVFGCLGNHELWTRTEDSITRLFAARGFRILRQERALIQSGNESFNLLGVDFQSLGRGREFGGHRMRKYLENIEPLIMPETTNILLSHNPNTFDRAAELGIDLSLAGHTHGGQITLEYISPSISPSRLVTRYVKGWFQKRGSQLYVNSGIGTIGVPMRIGAPPEITVYELRRT